MYIIILNFIANTICDFVSNKVHIIHTSCVNIYKFYKFYAA